MLQFISSLSHNRNCHIELSINLTLLLGLLLASNSYGRINVAVVSKWHLFTIGCRFRSVEILGCAFPKWVVLGADVFGYHHRVLCSHSDRSSPGCFKSGSHSVQLVGPGAGHQSLNLFYKVESLHIKFDLAGTRCRDALPNQPAAISAVDLLETCG